MLGKAKRVLGDNNSCVVDLVHAYKPGSQIDGIANDRKALGDRRTDRAENHLSGCKSHLHALGAPRRSPRRFGRFLLSPSSATCCWSAAIQAAAALASPR